MSKSIRDVTALFKFNSGLFMEKVAELETDQANRRPVDNVNPIIWLAGHMVATRNYLLGLMESQLELNWGDQFSKPYDPSATYPSMAEVKKTWSEVSNKLHDALDKVDKKKLDEKIELGAPIAEEAVRGGIIFFLYHEAWHLGQVSYALRGFGSEGLVGN